MNLVAVDTLASLTDSQWALLATLVHGYDERPLITLARRLIGEQEDPQSPRPLDEGSIKEFFTLFFNTTEVCLCSNKHLRELSSNDRSTLIRTGADSFISLGFVFILYQSELIRCSPLVDALTRRYGHEIVSMILHSTRFVDTDVVITKLARPLLMFSKNIFIFPSRTSTDHLSAISILQIQHVYAEVIWKYLLHKYSQLEAVRRFVQLTQCLLAVTTTMSHLRSVQAHLDDIESVAENAELQFVLDDIEDLREKSVDP